MNSTAQALQHSIAGLLFGTAVGDALGLPAEGLAKHRAQRVYPGGLKHRFVAGRGMVSDDTEHTYATAQALIGSAGEPGLFAKRLSRELRLWLLGLPAGTGLATLKAVLRLSVGFSPERSGVFSAGNGPAMRAGILGVCDGHDLDKLRELVRLCTRITHTDPKAERGALAVALAAHLSASQCASGHPARDYPSLLRDAMRDGGDELADLVDHAAGSALGKEPTERFAEQIGYGTGVSGYIYATVPVVLHAWFRNPRDFRAAVIEVIRCGGDTDTTAAILGGIVGAGVGREGIPPEWVTGLAEWPRNLVWVEMLAARLAEVTDSRLPASPLPCSRVGLTARNAVFAAAVLSHGFRRLLPPY